MTVAIVVARPVAARIHGLADGFTAGHDEAVSDHDSEDRSDSHEVTVFDAVGGQDFFDRLVDRFYDRVETDDVLLEMYPEKDDLVLARRRLATFLGQYWGGPNTYSDERGHPRLRMRHQPFVVGDRQRRHWLHAMLASLSETIPETPLDEDLRVVVSQRMTEYLEMSAAAMVNSDR